MEEKRPLTAEINRFSSHEEKLHHLFSVMKQIIKEKHPDYDTFWQAKEIVLDLFKDLLDPNVRKPLWEEYLKITEEARNLKNFLSQQVKHAIEKLDQEISQIETDIGQYQNVVRAITGTDFLSIDFLLENESRYMQFYQESLYIKRMMKKLHSYKEKALEIPFFVIAKKNMIKRLNDLIHQIFPKRDTLMQQISQIFKEDMQNYLEQTLSQNYKKKPYYQIKEEIKKLQELSRDFLLHAAAFKEIRLFLSSKWEEVSRLEEKRKKVISQKKKLQKKNFDEALTQLHAWKNEAVSSQNSKKSKELAGNFSKMDLSKQQRQFLSEEIAKIIKALKKEKIEEKIDGYEKKNIGCVKIKSTLIQLLQIADEMEEEKLVEEYNKITNALDSEMSSSDEIQHFLCPIQERIVLKQEMKKDLTSEEVLQVKRRSRNLLKDQIESYRKIIGGSNLDFEKAMTYHQLIEIEKNRLENLEEEIEDLVEN